MKGRMGAGEIKEEMKPLGDQHKEGESRAGGSGASGSVWRWITLSLVVSLQPENTIFTRLLLVYWLVSQSPALSWVFGPP